MICGDELTSFDINEPTRELRMGIDIGNGKDFNPLVLGNEMKEVGMAIVNMDEVRRNLYNTRKLVEQTIQLGHCYYRDDTDSFFKVVEVIDNPIIAAYHIMVIRPSSTLFFIDYYETNQTFVRQDLSHIKEIDAGEYARMEKIAVDAKNMIDLLSKRIKDNINQTTN